MESGINDRGVINASCRSFEVPTSMLAKILSQFTQSTFFAFLILFVLVFCVYSNTFDASWHMDDYSNIVDNAKLHPPDLKPQSLYQSLFASPQRPDKLYRPLACLTLALNWYWGADDVSGYHKVNIAIHLLSAIFLFLTILKLFDSPNLKGKYQHSAYYISLLATLFWVLNPIHTQAITYIVQRMAAMAAMFYILSIYFYVSARTNDVCLRQGISYLGCGLSFVFAFASKQNAATLPLALILLEFVFFQDLNRFRVKKAFVGIMAGSGVIILLASVFLFFHGDPLSFINYGSRGFSPLQRLMTEPRIVVFYLSQIFYPVPTRLSIEHDVTVSTSLLHPWTTLPSILLVLVLIGFGLAQMKKRPILSFAILFFFLNHIIESTIIGLELVFEHRNYLPSFFLFLPVAVAFIKLFEYYHERKLAMQSILFSFLILLLIGLGSATYIRNLAWLTEKRLWEDAMQKAPGRARPVYNLAKHYYKRTGQLDAALQLYERALGLNSANPGYTRAITFNGMATVYNIKKDYQKVIELLKKSLSTYPEFEIAQYNLVLALAKIRAWDQAIETVNLLLSKHPDRSYYLYLKGALLNQQKKPQEALIYLRGALRKAPKAKRALVAIGQSFNMMGKYQRAEWFYRQAQKIAPNDMRTYFCLIENNLDAGDMQNVERYVERLFARFSINKIQDQLKARSDSIFMAHYNPDLLAPVITQKLEQISDEVSQLGLTMNSAK
jgi:tetratricopeptide (TPR) repeat protein